MSKINTKKFMQEMLDPIGVTINGTHDWDIQIHNDHFFPRVINEGPLGLGEAYMDKWWDCERLDILFEKVLRARLDTHVKTSIQFVLKAFLAKIINFQSRQRAKQVAYQHYNLGNPLFKLMLDKHMIYSCAYFKEATTLDAAQEAKLELICQKLRLAPKQRLLDIGCGWGGLAKYAAEKYGVEVVGITISKQQYDYAKENCRDLPIEIRMQDYRDLNETFDAIVSVGMFEHVGHKNYLAYMRTAHRALKENGLFLLHTIGANQTASFANEWILKYIFPNGMLPSSAQIAKAIENLFIMEDWQNFGAYYDQTLMAWHHNFVHHWPELKSEYDERFYRMWSYYLLSSAGAFRARQMQLWQIVLSKNGVPGVYMAPR